MIGNCGSSPRVTSIVGARVFDGQEVRPGATVVLDGGLIVTVGTGAPARGRIVHAEGCTLLPGLIDAHVHTDRSGLQAAVAFGVTTELEMQGHWTRAQRREVSDTLDLADLRSAGFGVTRPGGHPSHWFPGHTYPGTGDVDGPGVVFEPPFASTPDEARSVVANLIDSGSDYIKIMVEDGHVLGAPGLPLLGPDVVAAAVGTAHEHGMLAIAHTLTMEATSVAIAAGMDALAHLFVDGPADPHLIDAIAASGAFVVPCLVLDSSMVGRDAAVLAADPRVAARATDAALQQLRGSYNTYPQGDFVAVLATVAALHAAGVDILVGTDSSARVEGVGHGISVHHELQLLTSAGLTPIQALRAATSATATRFGLADRGVIRPGARADLLLVDGDPTTDVSDSLSIRQVWTRGVEVGRPG